MSTDHPDGFTNNWDYLRTELRWLDQVLMLAVSRQRKESFALERVSQTRADRVTSHWWKGLIALEGEVAYDEHRQPSSASKVSYQQQLETRIQTSYRQGVRLALPCLRDRLGLSAFEKNVVLMSLAPEMNRRYARLYRYLQGEEGTDLPTVDLVLRLLCRNDGEWRSARTRLTAASPLLRHDLLSLMGSADTFLNRPLQLAEPLIRYLLAEQPTDQALELLLHTAKPNRPALLDQTVEPIEWSELVLPESLLKSLQYIEQRAVGYNQAEEKWGFDGSNTAVYQPGMISLLTGMPGTGKSLAASAIAHALNTPLYSVNLTQVEPADYGRLLEEIQTQDPTLLLLNSAQIWFGRSARISPATLHQFLHQRRSLPGVTLLTCQQPLAVPLQWQRQIDQVLSFPLPGIGDRLRLWQQAFAPAVPLDAAIQWEQLATLSLSGGEIAAIAHESVLYAAAQDDSKLSMEHIVYVLGQKGKHLKSTVLSKKKPIRRKKLSKNQPDHKNDIHQ